MAQRLPLNQLERVCQKPDHRRIGNWMARRISRPAALRITWVVSPWGVSATAATLAAWACGMAAMVAFAWGTPVGWVAGAVLLHLWYLLDHVDGQLARLHGTASLDGVQLDYLMHHAVNLVLPLGTGYGLFQCSGESRWLFVGLAWSLGLVLGGVQHDARYKAFVARLKQINGRLEVIGGGGCRPAPQPAVPRSPVRLAAWLVRKSAEIHVIVNSLTIAALVQWSAGDADLRCGRIIALVLAAGGMAAAVGSIVRSQRQGAAEREYALWYCDPRNM